MPTRHPLHRQLHAGWPALLASVFLSLATRAEQSRPVAIEDLARRAEAVVHGKVSSLECRRDAAGHVYTQVELEVTSLWKGAATNRFVVTLAGGILGSRKVVVVGQPEFQVGEEVVVFASRNERGESLLLELGQGKFAVKREPASGESSVSNGVFGAPATALGKTGYRLPSQLPLTLEQLKERVQAATAAKAKHTHEFPPMNPKMMLSSASVRAMVTVALLAGGAVATKAFVNETGPGGVSLRWDLENFYGCDPSDPFCLPPDQNPSTLAIRFHLPSQPWSAATKTSEWNAIRAAFGQWQAIPGTKIKFEEAEPAGNVTDVDPEDGKSMVVWLPANQTYCGGRIFLSSTFTATTCLSYFDDGTLAEADIILNRSLNWFTDYTDAGSLSFFIEGVTLHEIGHLLGLNHSPAGGATMFYFGKSGVGPQAGLSADDIAGAKALYGTAPTLAKLATLKGSVTLNGAGVFGAVVVVEDGHGNLASAGLSKPDGSYQLPGLPPGNYTVRVTPLDPTGNGDAYLVRGLDIDQYNSSYANVATAFQPSTDNAVTLTAGVTTAKNFTVASGNPAFRITEVRNSLSAGARNSGDVAVQLHPGQPDAYVGVFVPGLPAGAASIRLTGDGVTYGAVQVIPNALRGMALIQVPVTVASDVVPGLRSIAVVAGGKTAWANGFVDIAPAVPDFNFDGLDDVFQRKWFAPFTSTDAWPGADPDHDGWVNAHEAETGTNPTDASSFAYRILSTKVTAQGTTVTWESIVGKRFQLFSRTAIAGAPWQAVGTPVPATGETTQKLDASAQTALKFYRVQIVP